MDLHFADSSALVRAYLEDESQHASFAELLLSGTHHVVTAELATVEVPRALLVARRSRRILEETLVVLLGELRRVTVEDELILVLPLDSGPTLARALELVEEYPLGTLDAIHLAVADREGRALAGDGELVFVTADAAQGQAATALGMTVRP